MATHWPLVATPVGCSERLGLQSVDAECSLCGLHMCGNPQGSSHIKLFAPLAQVLEAGPEALSRGERLGHLVTT